MHQVVDCAISIHTEAVRAAKALRRFRVNSGLEIYLTDFLNRTFAGEIAEKSRFLRRGEKKSGALYHAGINHGAGLRNDRDGATAHSVKTASH
ncbi:MAG: hypothetical protein ACLPWS_18790 [Rhodomicrobium sp.]